MTNINLNDYIDQRHYQKLETYTQTEVDEAISNIQFVQVVNRLPTSDIKTNKIYLVLNNAGLPDNAYNKYDLYIRVNNKWEQLDSLEFNIEDYYTSNEIDGLLTGKAEDNHRHDNANSSRDGFMSSSAYSKLNGIATGATKVLVDDDLSTTSNNPVENQIVTNALNGKASSTHKHGNLQSDGTVGTVSDNASKNVCTNSAGKISIENKNNHSHGNIGSGGVLSVSDTVQVSKNVVTDSSGNITSEDKNNHSHGALNSDGTITSSINSNDITNFIATNTTDNVGVVNKVPSSKLNESSSLQMLNISANSSQHEVNLAINTALETMVLGEGLTIDVGDLAHEIKADTVQNSFELNDLITTGFYYCKTDGNASYVTIGGVQAVTSLPEGRKGFVLVVESFYTGTNPYCKQTLTQRNSEKVYVRTWKNSTDQWSDWNEISYTGHTHSQYLTSTDISGKEDVSNKVSSLIGEGSNQEYPTSNLVYVDGGNLNRNLITNTSLFNNVNNGELTGDYYKGLSIRRFNNTDGTSNSAMDCAWNRIPENGTFKGGDKYTLSFYAKGTGTVSTYFTGSTGYMGNKAISSNGTINNPTQYSNGQVTFTLTSNWQRFYVTWELDPNSSATNIQKNIIIRTPMGSDSYMCGVLLEKGDIAHEWSPTTLDFDKTFIEYISGTHSDSDNYTSNGTDYYVVKGVSSSIVNLKTGESRIYYRLPTNGTNNNNQVMVLRLTLADGTVTENRINLSNNTLKNEFPQDSILNLVYYGGGTNMWKVVNPPLLYDNTVYTNIGLNTASPRLQTSINSAINDTFDNVVMKSGVSGLLRNDGTVDTTSYTMNNGEIVATQDSTVDLDDILTNGFYYCTDSNYVAYISNIPQNNPFYLIVQSDSLSYASQIWVSNTDTRTYVRNMNNNVWSDWFEFSYNGHTHSQYLTSSDVTGKENISNKVTVVSPSSNDTEYPSAKAVYNVLGNDYGFNLLKNTKQFTKSDVDDVIIGDVTDEDFNGLTVRRVDNSSNTYGSNNNIKFMNMPEYGSYGLGDTYTLSFYARGDDVLKVYLYADENDSAKIGVVTSNATSVLSSSRTGQCNYSLTDEWTRYYVTWQVKGDNTQQSLEYNRYLMFKVSSPTDVYICGVMFEKGSVLHDWCPNPVDVAISPVYTNGSLNIE